MKKFDDATLQKLKVEHGNGLYLLEAGDHAIVARAPGRAVWKKFRATLTTDRKADALELLVRDCVVHPTGAEFEAMLDERPGLAETFGNELADIAGAGDEAERQKL